MLPRFFSQLLSSPTPTTLLKVTSIYSFQRFITHSIKISEFLLVRTNSKIFPQYSHRKPHPVVCTQMDARTSGVEQIARRCHYTPLHTLDAKRIPLLDKLARLSLHRRLFVNFLPLVIPVRRDQSSILIIVPINDYVPWKSPVAQFPLRERSVGSLSLFLSLYLPRMEEEAGSSRVCVRLGDHPFSLPLHPHPV